MSLQELYERYNEQVQFLMVYIREAHPVDGWWLGRGLFNLALKVVSFTSSHRRLLIHRR